MCLRAGLVSAAMAAGFDSFREAKKLLDVAGNDPVKIQAALGKLRSYEQWGDAGVPGGVGLNGRMQAAGISRHHAIVLNAENQDWADLLGVPEAEFDSIPGLPLPDELHMRSERVGTLPNFHDIFRQEKLRMESETGFTGWSASTATTLHRDSYLAWAGESEGRVIWETIEAWLLHRGYTPL